MKALDPTIWEDSVKELRATELGSWFLERLEFIVLAAEKMMEDEGLTPAEGIRMSFLVCEQAFGQRIDGSMMAQLLGTLSLHWVHRDAFLNALTVFEHRIVQEAVLYKIGQLQQEAAKA